MRVKRNPCGALYATALLMLLASYVEAGNVKSGTLDRQNASSDIQYRLIFVARASGHTVTFPGHAYMMVGEYDSAQKVCRFDKGKIAGFFPSDTLSGAVSLMFPVPGRVGSDLQKDLDGDLRIYRLDIICAQNGYDAALKVIQQYVTDDKSYSLGRTDCVRFVNDILVGLKQATQGAKDDLNVPDKSNFQSPEDYLHELFRSNGIATDN